MIKRGTFGSVRDATIWQSNPSYNDGASASLYSGIASNNGGNRVGLVRFDLGFIRNHAPVCSAVLKLTQGYRGTSGLVRLHEVLIPWTEQSATWSSIQQGWDPFVLGSIVAASGAGGDRAVDVTGMVQDWVNGVPNDGFAFEEAATADRTSFYSSEYTTAARLPRLEICYVP